MQSACEWFHRTFTQDYISLKCFLWRIFQMHNKSHTKKTPALAQSQILERITDNNEDNKNRQIKRQTSGKNASMWQVVKKLFTHF